MADISTALELISKNPQALDIFLSIVEKEMSLPNIPTPTMGGAVFWNTMCEANGWKMQQNMITKHARILNSSDVRIAWGTINGMIRAFERYNDLQNKY